MPVRGVVVAHGQGEAQYPGALLAEVVDGLVEALHRVPRGCALAFTADGPGLPHSASAATLHSHAARHPRASIEACNGEDVRVISAPAGPGFGYLAVWSGYSARIGARRWCCWH